MQKYIQDTLRNNLRPVIRTLTRPQQKAVSEIVRGLFTAGTPVLRHLAQDPSKTARKQGQKYSYHLRNIAIVGAVDALALRKVKPAMRRNTIIAYDLTDVAKEFAEKMEKMQKIWDGSKRKKAPGYNLHGVGINGILLKLQLHDGTQYTQPQIRWTIIEELSVALDGKGIWVFDRGNDSKEFFTKLRQETEVRFIARVKENRGVVLKETGAYVQVKDLEPGIYTVYLMDHHNHTVVPYEYTLVIHKHLEEKEPIRLFTTFTVEQLSPEKIVTMYLERWGIENVFRRAKTKFQLEKIRVLSFMKLQNLIALIQLATIIATVTFVTIQKSTHAVVVAVVQFYKRFLHLKSLEQNLDSFISFMQQSLPPCMPAPRAPPHQITLFSSKCLRKLG